MLLIILFRYTPSEEQCTIFSKNASKVIYIFSTQRTGTGMAEPLYLLEDINCFKSNREKQTAETTFYCG
jgi:hypothetical protein